MPSTSETWSRVVRDQPPRAFTSTSPSSGRSCRDAFTSASSSDARALGSHLSSALFEAACRSLLVRGRFRSRLGRIAGTPRTPKPFWRTKAAASWGVKPGFNAWTMLVMAPERPGFVAKLVRNFW